MTRWAWPTSCVGAGVSAAIGLAALATGCSGVDGSGKNLALGCKDTYLSGQTRDDRERLRLDQQALNQMQNSGSKYAALVGDLQAMVDAKDRELSGGDVAAEETAWGNAYIDVKAACRRTGNRFPK